MFDRRLSDKIIAAHAEACDQRKMEIAELLMRSLEMDLSSFGGNRRERRLATELMEQTFKRHVEAKGST